MSRYSWFDPTSREQLALAELLPAPVSGDAGKVPTVKDDLTGYQLDTPSGGGGLSSPAAGSRGVDRGTLGFEYLGAGYSLDTGTSGLQWDTYLDDPTSGSGVAFTEDVTTDDFTFSFSGMNIAPAVDSLCVVDLGIEFSAALSHPARIILSGMVGGDITLLLPAGADKIYQSGVWIIQQGGGIGARMDGVDAADLAKNIVYGEFGIFKIAATTPLA